MKFWEKRIYADAAASTPLSRGVLREMKRLEKLFGNPGGLHQESLAAKEELEGARARAAEALGAHPDEIIFTSGGTESNNLAVFGVLRGLLQTHGELNAVTTPIEHPSVLEPLRALEREGLYITYLPVGSDGVVDPKTLRDAINEQTVFVSVQIVNSEMGAVQNIREFAKEIRHIKKERESSAPPLYLHCDASQAPLWLKLNVAKLGVDLLTLDAQKMMGPKSSGLLYVRRGTSIEPLIFGGGQEEGLRSGTANVVLAGAIAEALNEAQSGCEDRAKRVAEVRDVLWHKLKQKCSGLTLYGPTGEGRVANNLNISLAGLNGQMAVIALNARGIAASTRSACSAAEEEPSPVLRAMGASEEAAQEAVRFTLLPDVSERDAEKISQTLFLVAERYRK